MIYRVVRGDSSYDLEKSIDILLGRGWKLQGGVQVIFSGFLKETYFQAMTQGD